MAEKRYDRAVQNTEAFPFPSANADGLFFFNSIRTYYKKMGTIALKVFLVNFGGYCLTVWFMFLSNLPTEWSYVVLAVILYFWINKSLKERENWLHRREERRKLQRENERKARR